MKDQELIAKHVCPICYIPLQHTLEDRQLFTAYTHLTFIVWPLNPNVVADTRDYVRFNCPCLYLLGTAPSLSANRG